MKIEATGLGVSAGRATILEDIHIRFLPGQFIGILGPSGSGKSTLLTALSGRKPHSTGEVLYDDGPMVGRPGETIGFVPQDDVLHTALKTERLLTYSARLQMPGKSKTELSKLIDLILRSVGLEERKKTRIKKLSGGQRKRVSIAQELLMSPKALFLDEPTSGLDPELERSVMNLCARLAKEGRLVVMTTHILESINLFDRLLILVGGKTAFFGTPDEALVFFKVEDMHHIYPLLSRKEASRYPEKFRTSMLYRKYLK
ncbi:MAG: ABC transporter ATP-binding protein [Candidatus Eremiobacteraeota bacterium]|nr:ABC transporter ATP-binding protein [Candidatus Eremiobacteraeota bacterium]